jgi:type III pantothenate kinase
MNLVVDYGNTSAKVGIFNHQQLIESFTFASHEALHEFINQKDFENFIVSSVNVDAARIQSWASKAKHSYILSYSLPLPITILYSTPHTLGVDRIAGACAAVTLFPNQTTLVIDAGTCITYDLTDRNGQYFGGGISPGLMMRFEALHTFTTRLPLVKPLEHADLVGNSTESSIQSGVINGTISEIDGIIDLYREKYPDIRVILCGGDAPFFENQLKASIFASPYLVLFGLNSVLIHNVRI